MEIHHPHHPTHKKKWNEYIIEFVMLFAAVTLGFFAENVREHQLINHRIEQNKVAILKDLVADSLEIARVIQNEDSCIKRFNRINNFLYLAKKQKISHRQLIDSIKSTPQFFAYSITLYMNNSSFKNMQSSGLLGNLEEGDFKNALGTYYEVDFKSIEAGNQFFDQVGSTFNNYYPIGLGKLIRSYQNFSKEYVLNDGDQFQDFLLELDKTQRIINSDDFIFEVQKYYNWIFIYRVALLKAKKSNDVLLKILRTEIN